MRRDAVLLNASMIPVLVGLLILLGVSLVRWGADGAVTAGFGGSPASVAPHPAAGQTRQFFEWPGSVRWTPLTNSANPFFTLAIQPPPPKAPVPPPATKKVEVTYRGFLETSAGVRRAVVQVAEQQILGGRGDRVVADLAAAEIGLAKLTLTNGAGQVVELLFAKPQSIEVPAK
jgi:hypothetical protein